MNEPESLYGNQAQPPVPQAPSLLDQVVGVFTEPVALFTRLEKTPVWGGALALLTGISLVVSVLWAKRVDVDAMIRPVLERNPKIAPETYDTIIAMQTRMMLPISIVSGLIVLSIITVIMAFVYWLVGKGTAERQPPSYQQVFSATIVSSLVGLPKFLLLGIICALRNIGGARPDALSPTSLGFYMAPDSVKLHALFNGLDLFNFASLLMLFLACRYTMRLKPVGAFICVLIAGSLMIGMPVVFAR
jgi:hypothetical protein